MEYSFFAELKADIKLSNNELNLLYDCSYKHYDINVQSLSTYERGKLYRLKNTKNIISSEFIINTEFSYGDLNLMIKSLEYIKTDDANFLTEKIYKVLKEMQHQNMIINKILMKK